jgi:hydroxymethylglutaryl-CoA lyase
MAEIDIRIISLADTVGLATKEQVSSVTKYVVEALPHIETGVHLHSAQHNRKEKLDAAINAGCTRFDAAIKGIGGCPMAGDDLVGNMDTEFMINHFKESGFSIDIDFAQLQVCNRLASEIFI